MRIPLPRGLGFGVAAALVATALAVAPATPAAAEEVYPRPANGVYVFDGHGWGHGRGLNQWGAQGAALSGVAHTTILSTYYPGTTATTIAERPMRVLIQEDEGADTHVVAVAGLQFADVSSGRVVTVGTSRSRWRARVTSNGFYVEGLASTGWVLHSGPYGGPIRFQGATPLRLALPRGDFRDYRGTISAVRNGTTAVATVNTLSMEHYLYGVVPRESPSWFHTEALRAQSVAARSYSAYKRDHVPAASPWDICSTTQCQVYGGMRHVSAAGAVTQLEQASTTAAINATRNVVRAYQGAPIFAEFSSSNGGWSTTGNFPYLAAKSDPWDRLESPHHSWTGQVSVAQIEARYPSVGTLTRLRVVTRDGNGEWGGRVKRVLLDGVKNGANVTVEASGGGIVLANQWPGSSNGIRGSWWKIRTSGLASSIVTQSRDLTLVRPPGRAVNDQFVEFRNTGVTAWPVDGLHLATPAGSWDPFTGGSTKPGVLVEPAGATAIQPGQIAKFRVRIDMSNLKPGVHRPQYRVRLGSGEIFGATVTWRITLVDPVFAAVLDTPTAGERTTPHGTVVVDRTGRSVVRVTFRNTGNVTWPVGGEVKLGTSSPRGRASASSGPDWLASSRPSALVSSVEVPTATGVAPGQHGVFEIPIYGNALAAGTTVEYFEPLWEGRAWMGGQVRLYVVRVDPTLPRHAEVFRVAPPSATLVNAPTGVIGLHVQLRNVGGQAWPVGGSDVIATAGPADRESRFRTPAWASGSRATSLVSNLSRPGAASVEPGEVGAWVVPLSALRVPAGTYAESFQAIAPTGRYGPVVTTTLSVRQAVFTGAVTGATPRWSMSRTSRRAVYFDVRNTGNAVWPVGGAVRSAALSGSGSQDYRWLSPTRPSTLTRNVTRPGAVDVRPGEVARFEFVIDGRNRPAGTYTEYFGVAWEGYKWSSVRATLSFTLL